MTFKADFAKIKRWREERHWSQEHLAEIAGVGVRTVQRIENGETASKDSLAAIAAAFNVDAIALVIDPKDEARENALKKEREGNRALRLSFFAHLVGYLMGMIVFAAIGFGMNAPYMLTPAIWWTVGLAGHAVPVVLVEIVRRNRE